MEATKNIYVKDEITVDYSTVTRWFKKLHQRYKNFDDHARSRRPKNVDTEVVLQAIEANLEWFRRPQSLVLLVTFMTLTKSIQSGRIMSGVTKILQNFDSP